jgi:hypothetical protein
VFTVTVAVPDTLVFWVEVAVMVTNNDVFVPGAVNSPEEEILPALAAHVTAMLKFPVPLTVAEHWLVPPDVIVEGEQLTETEVTVDVEPPLLPPLPPQDANHTTLPSRNNNPNLRTIILLSLQRAQKRRSPGARLQ